MRESTLWPLDLGRAEGKEEQDTVAGARLASTGKQVVEEVLEEQVNISIFGSEL